VTEELQRMFQKRIQGVGERFFPICFEGRLAAKANLAEFPWLPAYDGRGISISRVTLRPGFD
jgi:hypothetical protein